MLLHFAIFGQIVEKMCRKTLLKSETGPIFEQINVTISSNYCTVLTAGLLPKKSKKCSSPGIFPGLPGSSVFWRIFSSKNCKTRKM